MNASAALRSRFHSRAQPGITPAVLRNPRQPPALLHLSRPSATASSSPPCYPLLGTHLRAPLGGHSPESHIRLAYQLGREAARIYTGERRCFESASISSRRTVYVILAGDLVERPFFTHSTEVYFRTVKPRGGFDPASISHGFASISEAEAFCLGAGLPGLPRSQ